MGHVKLTLSDLVAHLCHALNRVFATSKIPVEIVHVASSQPYDGYNYHKDSSNAPISSP